MDDWTPICRLDDIPPLGARRVRRPAGADVALFRTADARVFALLDRCPHKGGPLSQGLVFGEHVACPLHNWTIALADGQACAPDAGATARFSVRLEAGLVSLRTSELATLAVADGGLPESAVQGPAHARASTCGTPAPAARAVIAIARA